MIEFFTATALLYMFYSQAAKLNNNAKLKLI